MAKKKKKGLASLLRSESANTEVVKEQKPKTIYNSNSSSNGGGLASGLRSASAEKSSGYSKGGFGSSSAETATQRAERERSSRMRSHPLVSIAKTMSKNSSSNYKTTLPSVASKLKAQTKSSAPKIKVSSLIASNAASNVKAKAPNYSIAKNALAPVNKYASAHRITGGQGVGNSKPVLGYKKTQILSPIKHDINTNYYDSVRKVGMKGSRNERKVYVPKWQRDENGQISTNQRRLENAARSGNRKAQVEAALARTKAKTGGGRTYDQFVNAELNKKGLLGQDYILRGKAPSKEAKDYRKRYGFDKEAYEYVKNLIDNAPAEGNADQRKLINRIKAGYDESFRARKIEDTMRTQYGVELTPEEQERMNALRGSGGYMVGNMLGQATQFAATAPLSGLVEGRLLSKVGLSGGKAAIKTAKDAFKYAGARIGADQIVSAPINLLDAMKEDKGADIIKRFGLNTGMDIIFSGLTEVPALIGNIHFAKGKKLNDIANATSDATEKYIGKKGAHNELKKIPKEEYVTAEQKMKKFVNDVNDEAETRRSANKAEFANSEKVIQSGVTTSREAIEESVSHGVPNENRYEWQIDYSEARQHGLSADEAVEYADAALDDAIRRNAVRHSRDVGGTPSERLANAHDSFVEEEPFKNRYVPSEDPLERAARLRDENVSANSITDANGNPVGQTNRLPENKGVYGREMTERHMETVDMLRKADEADSEVDRLLEAYDRPIDNTMPADEQEIWESTYRQTLGENFGMPNAEQRAIQAADNAVLQKRNIELAQAVNRANEARRTLNDAERSIRETVRQEPVEEVAEQPIKKSTEKTAKKTAKKPAKETAEEVADATAERIPPESMTADEVIDSVTSNEHIEYSTDELQTARATLEDALYDNPMNADAEEALDYIDQELYRRGEEPQWDLIEPSDRSTENAMIPPKKNKPKAKKNKPKAEEPKAEEPKIETTKPKKKAEAKKETIKEKPKQSAKPKQPAKPKNESVQDATYRLLKKWGNDEKNKNLVRRYADMSPAELASEKRAIRNSVKDFNIDPEEAADRIAVLDAVSREKGKLNTGKAAKEEKPTNWNSVARFYKNQDTKTLEKNRADILKKIEDGKMPKADGEKRIELIDDAIASKKQRDLDLEAKQREQEEFWGDDDVSRYRNGMPKEIDGVEQASSADSFINVNNPYTNQPIREKARDNVLNNGAANKVTRGYDKNLQSAKERYESNPTSFKDTLLEDAERVGNGKVPKHRDNFQDFFDDAAYLLDKNKKAMESLEKGSEEYEDLVLQSAKIAEGGWYGGSQMGAGLNHYKIFARTSDPVKDKIINRNLERLETEFERRLSKKGIKELDFPDELRDAIKKAKTPEEISKAWTDASIYVWNQIPASALEKINFLRINGMLLNPATHIRNYFGNFLFLPLREAKNIIGTPMEIGAEKLGLIEKGARTKAIRTVKEFEDYGGKMLEEYNDSIRGVNRYFEGFASGRPMEGPKNLKDVLNDDALRSKIWMAGVTKDSPILNGIRKFLDATGDANSWLLEHEDFRFFDPAFKKQFSRTMSARGLSIEDLAKNKKLRDEVIEVATDEALRATYRDESALSKAISGLKNPKKKTIPRRVIATALDAILPFTKTPINIMRRAIDYSPIGFLKGNVKFWTGVAKKDQKAIVKGIDQLASSIPGSGIAAAGFLWAKHDGLTGNLGSDDDEQFMKDLGKQKFSAVFHIGDKELSFTLDWAAPACIPLFAGAEVYRIAKNNGFKDIDFWEVTDVLDQMLEPVAEMSVMRGVKDTLDTYSKYGKDGVTQGLTAVGLSTGLNYLNQIIHPTMVSKLARTIDPIRRDTSSNADSSTKRMVDQWVNKQIAGIPFASKKLKPYQNAWSEDQYNTYSKNTAGRILENFVSPGYLKEYKADSVDKKLLEIAGKDPNASGLFPEANWKGEVGFDGGTVKLEKDEITKYNKEYGKVKKELKKLFGTSEFKNASLSEQEKMIQGLYTDQKSKATREVLLAKGYDAYRVYTDHYKSNSQAKHYLDAKNAGIPAKTYDDIMSTKDWDLDGTGSPSKPELVKYLNSRDDLNDEQRGIFFSKLSTAKNPYKDGTAHTTDWDAEFEKTSKSNAKRAETNKNNKFAEATPRKEGSIAAKLFSKSVIQQAKDAESNGSSKGSKGGRSGRRGRSGRGGGSSKGTTRKQTASERKFANGSLKLSSVNLEKIYSQNTKVPKVTSVSLAKIYAANSKLPASQKIPKVDLDAIFRTSNGKIKTPTYREISKRSLKKSQRKALLKLIQKGLDV